MTHPARIPVERLLADCREQRTRGSGPGGQHRNKVETAITMTHLPTQIVGVASERREQAINRLMAIQRLRVRLALAVRTHPDDHEMAETQAVWRRYISSGKLRINPENPDFPVLLSDGLDRVCQAGGQLTSVAERLGLSATQLGRFFKLEPAAWLLVNRWRGEQGLRPLK